MSAVLIPGSAVPAQAKPRGKAKARAQPSAVRRKDPRLAACVLAVVVLLELAMRFWPDAMLLHPFQKTVLFKQVSGYAMLALMTFAMAFGGVRRMASMVRHQARLNELHQLAGLLLLVLLASHLGQTPAGFLHYMFHAMAVATGAGALRALLGRRLGSSGNTALLGLHIGLSCLVVAGVLVHLYLVYAYTA